MHRPGGGAGQRERILATLLQHLTVRFEMRLALSQRRNLLCQIPPPPRMGSTTEVSCKTMKKQGRYRHLRVDWVDDSPTQSITLCGVEGEDIGTGQALCPNCSQGADALNVCGLGPESLRELFDTLRVIDPSEVKAKMEALRSLGVQMDIQDRSQLN